jgi:hypothetical protein
VTCLSDQFIEAAASEIARRCLDGLLTSEQKERGLGAGEAAAIRLRMERAAAIFLGQLIEANGCSLEEIVKAAVLAESERLMAKVRPVGNGQCDRYGCDQDYAGPLFRVGPEPGLLCRQDADTRSAQLTAFDLSAFTAALIIEGLWRGRGEESGPSWFDEHARFMLPGPEGGPCKCGADKYADLHHNRRFCGTLHAGHSADDHHNYDPAHPLVVPRLTFNHEHMQ